MSYRDPQLNVRSDAALYTNFFNSISSSFAKVAEGYAKGVANKAALIKANKENNDAIDKEVATYTSKLQAGIIKVDSSSAVDLVESYKPMLAKLGENKKLELSGNATKEQLAEYRDYELKAMQSIQLSKKGLVTMAENGADLVASKEDGTFDNELNNPNTVLGFQMIGKGGVNNLVIDVDDPMNINWNVSSKGKDDEPGKNIASYNLGSIVAISEDAGSDYWVTTPKLDFQGVGNVIMSESGDFNDNVPTKDTFTLIKDRKGEKTYQVTQVLDIDAMRNEKGSTIDALLEAKAFGVLEYQNQAASLWNNNLSKINKQEKWTNPVEGEPLTEEQKTLFIDTYKEAFYEGQGKTYSKKLRTVVNPKIEDVAKKVKPGKAAAALLANLKSLEGGQVGSFFEFQGKTVKQTAENEWTLTEEVVDNDGNSSTKVIATVDDPNKLKDKFGITDAALVPEAADLDVDMAVNASLGPIAEENE